VKENTVLKISTNVKRDIKKITLPLDYANIFQKLAASV